MDFKSAENEYLRLLQLNQSGKLSPDAFQAEIDKLRLQDDTGRYWCISRDGSWLSWDGSQWVFHSKIQSNPYNPSKGQHQKGNGGQSEKDQNTQPGKAADSLPESFIGLLLYILKKLPGTFLKRLPMMLLTGGLAWVAHIYVMADLNEGFNMSRGNWYNPLLYNQSQKLSPMILWTAIGMALPSLLGVIFKGRIFSTIGRLFRIPSTLTRAYKSSGKAGLSMLLLGAGISCMVGKQFSTPTNLIFSLAIFSSLGNTGKSAIMLVFTTAWNDIKRWTTRKVQKRTGMDLGIITLMMSGSALAFALINLEVFKENGFILGLVLAGVGIVLKFTNMTPKQAMMILAGLFFYYAKARVVFADDGGKDEGGGTWARWATSEGAYLTMIYSLFPGLSVGIGLTISTILRDLLKHLGLEGLIPPEGLIPEDMPPSDSVDQPADPTHRYWVETSINNGTIKTDGEESCWVYGKVMSDNPEADTGALTAALGFSPGGRYGSLLQQVDSGYVNGYKCVCYVARMPLQLSPDEKTGSASVSIGTGGPNGYISGSQGINLTLLGQNARLETATMPGGTKTLTVGDPNVIWLYGRVVSVNAETGETMINNEAMDTIRFTPTGEGSDWLFLSSDTARVEGGWLACGVKARNPYGDSAEAQKYKAPSTVTATIRAIQGQTTLSSSVTFTVIAQSDLIVDHPYLNFISQSGETQTVTFEVLNPGSEPWSFEYEISQRDAGLCAVEDAKVLPNSAKYQITLKECDDGGEIGGRKDSEPRGKVTVIARGNGGYELRGEAVFSLVREGLYLDGFGAEGDGSYLLKADGKSVRNIGFQLVICDPNTKKMIPCPEALSNLSLMFKRTDSILVQNAASVTGLDMIFKEMKGERTGIYTATTKNVFHAKEPFIPVHLIATADVPDRGRFEKEFVIKIQVEDNSPGSKLYEEEYKKCEEIIDKLIPAGEKARFRTFLFSESQKKYMDADGLAIIRKLIINQAISMNERLSRGYLEEAEWYTKAIWWCEKLEFVGDIAFEAVIAATTGGMLSVGAGLIKSTMISAYTAHVNGMSMDEWVENEMNGLLGLGLNMGIGFITDPVVLQEYIGKSKTAVTAAWTIFIGYNFAKALYDGMSIYQAAEHVAKMATQQLAVQFLSSKLSKNKAILDANKAMKDLENMVSRDAHGNPTLPPGVAEKIMTDPQFVRSIKNSSNENLKLAFEDALRKDVYRPHDAALENWIKQNVPGMEGTIVKVNDFRTPKTDGSTEGVNVNADRDYRVMYKDRYSGEWKELPKEHWEKQSYKEFAKSSGFDPETGAQRLGIDKDKWNNMTPEQQQEQWARAFRQTPTDQAHIVSSRDFSDQLINPETGRPFPKMDTDGNVLFETTRRGPDGEAIYTKDPNAKNIALDQNGDPVVARASNIELVKDGRSKLLDPKGMGEMYERKVFDEWQLNGSKSEGIEQIKKGFKELEAVRSGYEKQGINIEGSPEYQKIKAQFEGVRTDMEGKNQVGGVSERDMNKALAHLANEFKKFPSQGR